MAAPVHCLHSIGSVTIQTGFSLGALTAHTSALLTPSGRIQADLWAQSGERKGKGKLLGEEILNGIIATKMRIM